MEPGGPQNRTAGSTYSIEQVKELGEKVMGNMARVIAGKNEAIELLVTALLARRHVLIQDVPGVGKTTLARSLAKSLGCSFRRIQFTPDLLPSDITGISIYDEELGKFRFRPGPIMSQLVLADEINRTSPKTQSALLEAMEEGQISVDGHTYDLPRPFMVMATQNPVEYEGTFPLPESQLDRFGIHISLGYPGSGDELRMLAIHAGRRALQELGPVTSAEEVAAAQEALKQVYVSDAAADYIVRLVQATRDHGKVYLGASPRATLALYELARARAALRGRPHVTPDDVKSLAVAALAHRIILDPEAQWEQEDPREVVAGIIGGVRVPVTPPPAGGSSGAAAARMGP